jgi:hypothetical protein
MKINQFFLSTLSKDTISALDEKVVVHHKDPSSDVQFEYGYQELSTSIVKGKTGESNWMFAALILFALTTIIDSFVRYLIHYKTGVIFIIGFSTTIIVFCLRFIKYEFVNIYTLRDDFAFHVKLSGKDRADREKFIHYVLEKIRFANTKNDMGTSRS